LRIFTGFNIPTYVWFDGDKNTTKKENKDKTIELLNLLGDSASSLKTISTTVSNHYAIIEDNYELLLLREISDYEKLLQEAAVELGQCGKPLKHRYIANKIMKKVVDGDKNPKEVVPETIQKIISNLKNLNYCIKVLQD